jgi:hypothetical protein
LPFGEGLGHLNRFQERSPCRGPIALAQECIGSGLQVHHVDADPLPAETLRDRDGGAAAAEGSSTISPAFELVRRAEWRDVQREDACYFRTMR